MEKSSQVSIQKTAGHAMGVMLAYDTTKLLTFWSNQNDNPKPTFSDILEDVKFYVLNKFGEAISKVYSSVIGKEFIEACIDPDAIREGYDLYMKEEK